MALLGIIRRWHIRDQIPLREIARRLGISRNTVRRYLRAEMTEPSYADRRTPSAIDKYAFQLSGMLKDEAAKSRKQRRTLKQIHEDLKQLGFEGSYDRVAAFARVWRAGQTERVNSASKRTGGVLAYSGLERGGESGTRSLSLPSENANSSRLAFLLKHSLWPEENRTTDHKDFQSFYQRAPITWHHSTLSLLPNNRSVALTSGF